MARLAECLPSKREFLSSASVSHTAKWVVSAFLSWENGAKRTRSSRPAQATGAPDLKHQGVSEMVQQVKKLAAKPEDLSSIPSGGKESLLMSIFMPHHAPAYVNRI